MKSNLIKGTLILTIAGLITRVIGFFYRILLSNTLGDTNLGIYQLIFPIYGICFTLYASGIQTAISQLIANESGRLTEENEHPFIPKKLILAGLSCSICIALTLSVLLFSFSDWISLTYLKTPECAPLLKILSVIFPFCGVTSVINGIFYGIQKAKVPASNQLIEQIIRVSYVFIMSIFIPITCEIAVWGLVLGELGANLFNLFWLFRLRRKYYLGHSNGYGRKLLTIAFPLSATRLVVALLTSLEAVLIPYALIRYGFSKENALSFFGIITGIALPFIMFPGAITNSLSVLLLPEISSANGMSNKLKIKRTSEQSIKFTLLLGLFASGVFCLFGKELALLFFHNSQAGTFLLVMSPLCPFIYCSTTLSSIINGLGKTHITFRNTVISLSVRITALIFLTPLYGIYAYLFGLALSYVVLTILDGLTLYHLCEYHLEILSWFVYPGLFLYGTMIISKELMNHWSISSYCFIIPFAICFLSFIVYLKYFHILEYYKS